MAKVGEAFASESAYLKQADIGNRRVAVTIKGASYETVGQGTDQEDKWILHFEKANKGLVLNKTNAETIADLLGDDEMDNWAGHKIVLYVDKNVMMGGKKVGGIRVMEYQGPKPVQKTPPPPPPAAVEEGFEREPGADDGEDVFGS